MRKRFVGIAAAAVLAIVGTVLLVLYVNGAEARALKDQSPVDVLVVTDKIVKGTKVEDISGKVRPARVPAKVRAAGAVASVSPLTGQVALIDLLPGEQVVRTRFAEAALAKQEGVPAGMMQVTVALDSVRAMGGKVRQGDTVGVLASFSGDGPETTRLILRKVRVTGVQADSGPVPAIDKPVRGNMLVGLALDGPSVERLVFAAEHGKLWLSADPADAPDGGTKIQTRGTVNG